MLLLNLTTDSYARQHSNLDSADFAAAWALLAASGTETGQENHWILFYNCGAQAGCSRVHKHMQFVQRPPPPVHGQDLPPGLWPDRHARTALKRSPPCPKIPFKYYCLKLEDVITRQTHVAAHLHMHYERMVAQCLQLIQSEAESSGELWGAPFEPGMPVPHNLIMTKDWMMVIPRRSAGAGGVYANALKFVGMMWEDRQEAVDIWREKGVGTLLKKMGWPSSC
jgi:ATP adenylyltransferase/5',5'''-P-1,P-4-tetraphosphate phosphorylase II